MRTGMHLTIQDYFNNTGFGRNRAATAKYKTSAQLNGASSFTKALTGAQSSSAAKRSGRTIQDYFARPVHMRHIFKVHEAGMHSADAMPPNPKPGMTTQPPKADPPKPSTPPLRMPANEAAGPPVADDDGKGRIQAGIDKAAARFGLPPALIEAVIKAESDFDVLAVSPAGALGLMQLMPATANELGVGNPFDADENIHGGARYLRNMLDRFGGDIRLALSAYNAGPGTVARFNGHVPYPETRNYVRRVMKYTRQLAGGHKVI